MCTLFPFCLAREKEITVEDLDDVIQSLAIHIAAREYHMKTHAAKYREYEASGDKEGQRSEKLQYEAHRDVRSRYMATRTKLVQISIHISTAAETVDIAHAMGNARDVLGALIAKVKVADIDALMDELNEYKIEANEASEAMGREISPEEEMELLSDSAIAAPPRSGGARAPEMELPSVPAPPRSGVATKSSINTKEPILA